MPNFRLGRDAAATPAFAELQLSVPERRQLCFSLLEEFGANNVSETRNGEIRHSCILPFGGHANGDRTPSARLNFEKLTYNCWVCGGGGLLWFVSTMRNEGDDAIGRTRVLTWLRERSGAGGYVQDVDALMSFLDSLLGPGAPETTAVRPPRYDPRILDPWRCVHPYLTEMRHIPVQNVIDMQVGYGVLTVPKDDQKVQSHRIVVPHFWMGELVGWQSRRLIDDGTAKWIGTPGLPKDTTLFNYNPMGDVVMVEAPLSVVAHCHQAHMEAVFGANVTDRQMDLIASHSGRVILFFDNDSAGWLATERVAEYVGRRNSNVWVVDNPYLGDPADLGDEPFSRLLRERLEPAVLWSRPNPEALTKWERNDAEEVRDRQGAR